VTLWRWAVLAGLIALATSIGFGSIEGIKACSQSGDAILNFEFVRTPEEVAALFPADCRAVHVEAQRSGLWLDALVFIPAYSAFLMLSLAALLREDPSGSRRGASIGMVLTLIAALCDQFEGFQLFAILNSMPGTQAGIDQLIPAVRAKFALLALVVILAGWLHLRRPGWRRIAGTLVVAGGVWSMAGLIVDRAWLIQGSALAWLALLVTNILLSIRRPA
jgi:hypothetical protein